jgi:type II secretory pathway component PulJ
MNWIGTTVAIVSTTIALGALVVSVLAYRQARSTIRSQGYITLEERRREVVSTMLDVTRKLTQTGERLMALDWPEPVDSALRVVEQLLRTNAACMGEMESWELNRAEDNSRELEGQFIQFKTTLNFTVHMLDTMDDAIDAGDLDRILSIAGEMERDIAERQENDARP